MSPAQPPSRAGLGPGDPIVRLPGVGPARAALLERLGVLTVGDLLALRPRRYEDRRRVVALRDLDAGAAATVLARVVRAGAELTPRRRRRIFRAVLADETGRLSAVWFRFRPPHLASLLRPGALLYVHGSPGAAAGGGWEMLHPELEAAEEGGGRSSPAVRPVYPAVEGMAQGTLRMLVRRALDLALPGIGDPLPAALRARLALPGLAESLRAVHAPGEDLPLAELAERRSPWHRRLAFEELFLLQVRLAARRRRLERLRPRHLRADPAAALAAFREGLSLELTRAQARVCAEIARDMTGPRPMQRLLQGDVGSGKTLVAACAVRLAVAGGAQAALLAPTEILAEQHFLSLSRDAALLGAAPALLTGAVAGARRASVLRGLADGSVRFVVGTHALLGEQVRFARLGLAVVDEQHRFGVRQRLGLREKGDAPDLLVMTATPIPRSLALAVYGDLDLSVIDELPPGRRPVRTFVVPERGRPGVWRALGEEIGRGRRAFVVCPLAREGDADDPPAAARLAASLRQAFPGAGVGLVHGAMPLEERRRAMERFRAGQTPILAATTVVEVGLDVPEATVMAVERAERFGLSQLHQLRGRVGRGPDPARCFLLTGPDPSAEARERLAVLARTADGFAVAEADLALRGPGEIHGVRQAGLDARRFAELARDAGLLAAAREEALRLLEGDPALGRPEHAALRARVEAPGLAEGPAGGAG